MGITSKQRDFAFGRFAEEKNWRFRHIEIDIIAQMGNTIVFVEVKARSGRDMDPMDAVTPQKMRRIARGADVYLRQLGEMFEYRYDIFTLVGDFDKYDVTLFPDAFVSPLM